RGERPEYHPRGHRDECHARPHGAPGSGPCRGRRPREANHTVRDSVRRRRGVRYLHGGAGTGDATPGGGARRARGTDRGGARGPARHGGPRHSRSRGRTREVSDHLARDVSDLARKWVPDVRLGVLDVSVEPERLVGATTSRDALTALRRLAAEAGRTADVRLLPDVSV